MSCGIYKWTSPNGKSYIGQSVNLERRKQDFINNELYTTSNDYKKLTVIDKARKKYQDFEQWTYEILEYCEPNELNDREQYYINLYNTFKNGYNETSGGGQNTEISDETRKKISDSLKGEKHPMYGKTLSKETREKIGKGNKGKTPWNKGKKHWNKGKIVSDETKEKMRQVHLGKTHSDEAKEKMRKAKHSKQVDQYSLDGVFIQSFVSLSNIKKQLGYSIGNIGECCNGKRKTAYGFIWRYHN